MENFNLPFSAFPECHPKGWCIPWVLLGHLPKKKDTNVRKAIPTAERLMLTMRFLGSGDSHFSLSYLLQIRKKSATRIVSKTSEAIILVLLQDYMTPQEMRSSGKTSPKNLVTYGNSHTL